MSLKKKRHMKRIAARPAISSIGNSCSTSSEVSHLKYCGEWTKLKPDMFDSFTISLVLWRADFCPLLSFRTRCENGVIARRTGEAGCKHLRLEFSPKVKKERKKTPCVEQSNGTGFLGIHPLSYSEANFPLFPVFECDEQMWQMLQSTGSSHWYIHLLLHPIEKVVEQCVTIPKMLNNTNTGTFSVPNFFRYWFWDFFR